tara:strand:+ start:3634 stop:4572 length:939 start_codon:yes stop_codon:yes gene_type:complete
MATIFKKDGIIINTPEVQTLQEDLRESVSNYETHVQSGYDELRTYRDDELKTSDWTQVPDSPLNSTAKTAWATYRTKLRDLPNDAKAPYWFEESDWPVAPGASAINPEALGFIERNKDPLGIATTSWVGITTNMVKKGSLSVNGAGIGTDIVGVADTTGVEVGDTVSYNGQTVSIVAGITTISVSLASTTPVAIYGDLDYLREGNVYYAQDRPQLTPSVSAAATTVVAGAGISFTITLTNQVNIQDVRWSTNYDYDGASSVGTMTITPVGTTGIGTVTVGISSNWQSDNLYLEVSLYNCPLQASASVGVTTT